ncbi:MAG: DUF2911 domain-containing protein [Acidobacteria bacterium]|nr:DUF2911 domain-containing protein [Acidobacteriota bacterium]
MFTGGVQLSSGQARPPLPRPSQKAGVMQVVGTTDISVSYSRPAVKGRKVFGDWPTPVAGEATLDDGRIRPEGAPLVPNDHIWRAGANEATLFTVADDVLINGQHLAAGKYSMHMIPGKADWTIIFNKDDGQWGSFTYNKQKDALRVKAKAEWVADNKELLTFGFENVGEKTATLYLRWEKVKVPFTIEVKDVVGSTMTRLKAYVAAAKSDDPGPRINAGNYAKANKQIEQANAWFEEALRINETMVGIKETFQNLQRKATILLNLGRSADALAAAERAVVVGKADPTINATDIATLEKRIADIKAGKN